MPSGKPEGILNHAENVLVIFSYFRVIIGDNLIVFHTSNWYYIDKCAGIFDHIPWK